MMLSLVGDAVVAVLLIATIAYAAMLNARLGVLRGDRAKLDELIQSLTVAAARAEAGIAALKAAAADTGRGLEKKIEEGRGLRDDLTYMLERGGGVADRLAGTIRARRESATPDMLGERKREPKIDLAPRAPAAAEPKPAANIAAARAAAPSRAERELLKAMSGR
ncbi:MAG TPA: DUF6468 domain-containing protein [Stellaceae bacterium]|nr:DUF6468 domain-containing protein [Stellaceae bacterium]